MRTRSGVFGVFAVFAALAVGCSGPGGSSDSVSPLFEVPRGAPPPGGFYALPFPNDIRLDADGKIDLSDYVRPNALAENFIDAAAEHQVRYSLSAPVLFRFGGSIAADTLPADPELSTAEDASIYLVVIDPDSPRYGERWPIKVRFEPTDGETIGENWLSMLPFPGFPLLESTTYAAVITGRVTAADGGDLSRAPDFEPMLADAAPGDADLARAHGIYAPLRAYLDDPGGDERGDVVSAAVFTTQDATSIMGKIREVIYRDVAEPAPRGVTLISENGLAHYDGLYDGPIFQRGTVPYTRETDGGDIELDGDGDPVVQQMVELRFAVTTPLGDPPAAGWPVVVYAHGTGGSYRSFINNGTAAALAAEGIAAISIDQTLHGPRNPGGDPEVDFFNFQNPLAARDNTLQGALDDFQLVRLVTAFDFTDPDNGRQIRFDADQIFFFGHSQGGLTGVPFVAFEPLIKGAVFSGAGGVLILSLLNKTEPIDITALVAVVVRDVPLDEFNPLLGLVQGYLDRADSASYAPLVALRPPAGNGAKHVFHSMGLIDNFTPVPSIEALATSLGVTPVNPVIQPVPGIDLAGIAAVDPPVSGNLDGTTAVLLEYQAPAGRDGHFVLFDVPAGRTQSIQFLSTLAADGTPTIPAP
jgi:predicted esterase